MISLLLANTSSAAAGGGGHGGSGEVSVSVTYPPQTTHLFPNASASLPGGGSTTATASIIYNAVTVYGQAKTSLSSSVPYTYSICAEATQLYKDGAPLGGAGQQCKAGSGGAIIYSTKTVNQVPYGHTWRADTYHRVSSSSFNWPVNLTVSANL